MKAMQKAAAFLFVFLFALGLSACTQQSAPVETTAPIEAEAPAQDAAPAEVETSDAPSYDLEELAKTMEGRPIEELIAVIGEPKSSDYAPSCLGPGEDGELVYDDFTVYTYREGDTETVEEIYYGR